MPPPRPPFKETLLEEDERRRDFGGEEGRRPDRKRVQHFNGFTHALINCSNPTSSLPSASWSRYTEPVETFSFSSLQCDLVNVCYCPVGPVVDKNKRDERTVVAGPLCDFAVFAKVV